ncbi:transmembrane protein 223 [Nematostella vectensis]|uniref:transmembrane protein 223 n=1 Tax=Nematostella vectensis TaxID=45351 RepID=UPI0013901B2B|nr:transmembrane protein 223 [Nematostella vectensis]
MAWVYLNKFFLYKGWSSAAARCKTCQVIRWAHQTWSTVSSDATLFHHDRRKFFRTVGLASTSQFFFWVYLAHFQYTTRPQLEAMKEKGKIDFTRPNSTLWRITNFIEKSPVFLPVVGVSVGVFLSFTGWFYCLRNINRIALLKGGGSLRLVTHTPLGGTREIVTPIHQVSSLGSRMDNKSQIAIKVKGYRFFFILDKEGSFVQPSLFDRIVGVKRSL